MSFLFCPFSDISVLHRQEFWIGSLGCPAPITGNALGDRLCYEPSVAFAPQSPLSRLLAGPMRPGRLEWIGVRPGRRIAAESRAAVNLTAGRGVDGDRYDTNRNGPRQVTLIAVEDVEAITAFLGLREITPALLRRNMVTRGINLLALKDRRFRVGVALLEGSGECAPCSRMEETFGPGGYSAVRGHGGITARVIEGGTVHIGDPVESAD
jgi:MOSC domain-containing protein YiiM